MGNFISDLMYTNVYRKVTIDLDNAEPSAASQPLVEEIMSLTNEAKSVSELISRYEDCTHQIKMAFDNPDDEEVLDEVFSVVFERVKTPLTLFKFSFKINEIVPKILQILITDCNAKSPVLAEKEAILLHTVRLLEAILCLDESKLSKPELQNDLAFYRRMLPKMDSDKMPISSAQLNDVISFLAEHMSITTALAKSLQQSAAEDEKVVRQIGLTGSGLFNLVHARKFEGDSTRNLTFLRSMAVCIILYDFTRNEGVFAKGSAINVRFIVKFLLSDYGKLFPNHDEVKRLANHIRYGCKSANYKKATSVQAIYEAYA